MIWPFPKRSRRGTEPHPVEEALTRARTDKRLIAAHRLEVEKLTKRANEVGDEAQAEYRRNHFSELISDALRERPL